MFTDLSAFLSTPVFPVVILCYVRLMAPSHCYLRHLYICQHLAAGIDRTDLFGRLFSEVCNNVTLKIHKQLSFNAHLNSSKATRLAREINSKRGTGR